jgi:hypothetical protein
LTCPNLSTTSYISVWIKPVGRVVVIVGCRRWGISLQATLELAGSWQVVESWHGALPLQKSGNLSLTLPANDASVWVIERSLGNSLTYNMHDIRAVLRSIQLDKVNRLA